MSKRDRINRSVVSRPHAAFQAGDYKEAKQMCEIVYAKSPTDVENLLLLAACHFQLGGVSESMFYAQQIIGADQTSVEGHIALGKCYAELGQYSPAIDIYNRAIRMQPRFAEAYAGLGHVHLQQEHLKEAIQCFEMAISLKPRLLEAVSNCAHALYLTGEIAAAKTLLKRSKQSAFTLLNYGNILHNEGDFEHAIEQYTQALKLEPSFHDAEINICDSLIELHKTSNRRSALEDAIMRLEKLINVPGDDIGAHSILGVCQTLLGRNKLAIRHFQAEMLRQPMNANTTTLCNLGGVFFKEGCLQQSAKLCFRALEIDPKCHQAFNLLGLIMFQLGNNSYANKCFQIAQKLLLPKSSPICNINLGSVLLQQGEPIAAAKMFKKAIAIDPFLTSAFLDLGVAYYVSGNSIAAEKCFQTCIDSKSDDAVALCNQMMLTLSQLNFDGAAAIAKRLSQSSSQTGRVSPECQLVNAYSCVWDRSNNSHSKSASDAGKTVNCCIDFSNQAFYPQIATHLSPETYRALTDIVSKRAIERVALKPKNHSVCPTSMPRSNERIKIGYVSSGFGNHTTGFLTQSIFMHHNKSKFFIQAISLSPSDKSSEWAQMEANVDKLVIFGRERNLVDLANMIIEDEIHILVDLDGYTKDSRLDVFAMRPAPIQISMLGHFGTTGSDSGMDYIVADEYSLPASANSHYSEEIMYIPRIVNSYRESKKCAIDFDTIDRWQIREEHGIPEECFVYACFAQPYKITPDMFAVWMETLKAVPNSLLILVRYSRAMEDNLRTEISNHSIDQERVIFWELVPRHKHMIRCCIADVVLDTICSGVATSYDAIWTNTPLVTIAGDKMSNRLGASLLTYLGLEQLVASDLDEYQRLAISLSEEEDKYMDIIRLLEDSRDESDLFDSKLWVESLEKMLVTSVHRVQNKI